MRYVIATLPDVKFSLGRDINLVKSCALYGDEAVLFSPTYLGTEPLLDFTKKPLLHQLLYQTLLFRDPGFVVGEKLTRVGRAARIRLARERSERIAAKASVAIKLLSEAASDDDAIKGLQEIANEIRPASELIERVWPDNWDGVSRARQLAKAEALGLVTIQNFHDVPSLFFDPHKLEADVTAELACPNSYGALDERFIRKLDVPPGGQGRKIKSVAIATSIFENLPGFPEATIEEIVDIRKELTPHLARFRKVVFDISDSIKSSPWDRDFPHEVDIELQSKLYPAVEAIGGEIKSNSYLREILQRASTNPLVLPATSAFGLLLSEASHSSVIVGQVVSGIVGTGLQAYEAYKTRQAKQRELEGNQFFFYYRASNLLKKRLGNATRAEGLRTSRLR